MSEREHIHKWSPICEACIQGKHWYCSCRKHCICQVCKKHDRRIGNLDEDYSEDIEFILDNDFSEDKR